MHPNDVCLEDVQFSYCFVSSSLPGGGGGGGETLIVYLDRNKFTIKSYYLLFCVFDFTSPSTYNPSCALIPR